MKKGILLVSVVLLVGILLLVGCGAPEPAGVSRAEHEVFKAEVTGRLDTTETEIAGIREAVKDLPVIRQDVSAIKGLLEGSKGQSDELVDLKIRMAVNDVKVEEREKDINELRQDVKDIPRYQPQPQPRRQPSHEFPYSIYVEKTGSLWVDETGYYELRISPDVEISIGGRKIISHEIVRLTRGNHTVRSPEPVSISYRLVYY